MTSPTTTNTNSNSNNNNSNERMSKLIKLESGPQVNVGNVKTAKN